MRFLLAAIWGLTVLAALIGWGTIIGWLLRPGKPLSWGLSGAIGFSFSVAFAGVLGFFHLILPTTIFIFVVLGLPLLMLRRRSIDHGKPPAYLLAILIAFLACRYLSSVHQTDFEPEDDIPGYLVFPVKMLQTGRFAPDPFSDRRMTGLGGQQWSQALVIAPFDATVINLFDHGIAVILLLLICGDWLTSIGFDRKMGVLLLLVLTLIYPNYLNSASFVTISALLLAIFIVLVDGIESPRETILLALLVAGICSLKITVIPLTGCILAVHFLARTVTTRSIRPLIFGVAVAMLTGIFLLPWMLAMHQSSNTFLPPLLGRGNSMLQSLLGTMPTKITAALLFLSISCAAAGLLIFISLGKHSVHRRWARTAAIFPLVTAPVIFVISEMTGGLGWMRYSQPFIYGWIALPIVACWLWPRAAGRPLAVAIALAAIGQCFGWARPFGPIQVIAGQCTSIANGIRWKPINTDQELQQSKAMQSVVPAGAVILERVDFPYLFDFKRNPIFIADHPGLAYPPPGLPEHPTSASLRSFLLDHGVRYVAYSYGDQAGYTHATAIESNMKYAWDRTVCRRTFGFQDALLELTKSKRILYDDQRTAVMDLSSGTHEAFRK